MMSAQQNRSVVSCSDDCTIIIWDSLTGMILSNLHGHTNQVYSINISPNGQQLVSSSADNTVRIWDYQTSKCIKVLKDHTDEVGSAVFSYDGKYLATASPDATIRIYRIENWECIRIIMSPSGYFSRVDFNSTNSNIILTSTGEHIGRIYNWQTEELIKSLYGHEDEIIAISTSPNGQFVLTASADTTLRLQDYESSECLRVQTGHRSDVIEASFSSDGERIVSASGDMTIRLWGVLSGNCINIIRGHNGFIFTAQFLNTPDHSMNDKQIISSSSDRTVRIWDADDGSEVIQLKGHMDEVNDAKFNFSSRYQQRLSNVQNEVQKLFELADYQRSIGHQGHAVTKQQIGLSLIKFEKGSGMRWFKQMMQGKLAGLLQSMGRQEESIQQADLQFKNGGSQRMKQKQCLFLLEFQNKKMALNQVVKIMGQYENDEEFKKLYYLLKEKIDQN